MLNLNIRAQFQNFQLTIDQQIPGKGISAIFGPSGSGKSTLLRCIAGFQACQGLIQLGSDTWLNSTGKINVPPHQRPVGYVFQDARLFSHLSVAGNLAFARDRAHAGGLLNYPDVIDSLALAPLLNRDVLALSGGEQQRVALARTLLTQPRLLMLDEPLSALDYARKAELLALIKSVCHRFEMPALFVSHAIDEVAQLASYALVIDNGRIQTAANTERVLQDPLLHKLTGRFESGYILHCQVTGYDSHFQLSQLECEGQTLQIPVTYPLKNKSNIPLFVRARDVSVATELPEHISTRNVLTGTLSRIEPLPQTPFAELTIQLGEQQLGARITRAAVAALSLTVGAKVHTLIKSASFDADG